MNKQCDRKHISHYVDNKILKDAEIKDQAAIKEMINKLEAFKIKLNADVNSVNEEELKNLIEIYHATNCTKHNEILGIAEAEGKKHIDNIYTYIYIQIISII